jgi:hypothetical protein
MTVSYGCMLMKLSDAKRKESIIKDVLFLLDLIEYPCPLDLCNMQPIAHGNCRRVFSIFVGRDVSSARLINLVIM